RSRQACCCQATTPQKFGATLCSAQTIRASNVVTNGFALICTGREAPALSLRINGDEAAIRASLGMRYRSPVPTSTYAPASVMSCQATSRSLVLFCGSTDTFLASDAMSYLRSRTPRRSVTEGPSPVTTSESVGLSLLGPVPEKRKPRRAGLSSTCV